MRLARDDTSFGDYLLSRDSPEVVHDMSRRFDKRMGLAIANHAREEAIAAVAAAKEEADDAGGAARSIERQAAKRSGDDSIYAHRLNRWTVLYDGVYILFVL